ncbi:hypothetical protein [Haloarcula salina]|uniref:Uncharacterized protein n=1 Tax=Haloarcula salina TaxID=1429914 RepID=A0AA41G146_9EURY|nr:hypothetical protein [Haloarcula salina]MBV0901604.1 hypothetical protein [Haloarcula salina]
MHVPSRVSLTAFAIAGVLAAIAIYNYASGVYGGAIVSSIGTVVATLLGTLAE